MEYTILSFTARKLEDAILGLENDAKKYIAQGWEPLGGIVVVANANTAWVIIQALTR